METCYLVCAGLGGSIIILQFLGSALGLGVDHDHDFDHDHDGDHGFLSFLTLRSIAASVTFFGLAGLTGLGADFSPMATLALASLGGFVALYSVASIMKGFKTLKHDGTAKLERAVGLTGTVYLRVPGANAGPGKVTLTLQNRTIECEAYSAADELPTGRTVRVIAVRDVNAVDVESF